MDCVAAPGMMVCVKNNARTRDRVSRLRQCVCVCGSLGLSSAPVSCPASLERHYHATPYLDNVRIEGMSVIGGCAGRSLLYTIRSQPQ